MDGVVDPAEHFRAYGHAEPLSTVRPTRIITYAWGEKYVDALLSLALPAALAPGNLPYVASAVPCEFVILTQERFFPTVTASPVVARIRDLCPVRLIGLDDLVTMPDKYGMTLTYALHRGFADLGDAMTERWLLFLNADFILAAGSWRNLLRRLAAGERLVASPSYCVRADEVVPALRAGLDLASSTLTLVPRKMASLILRHRHNTIRGKTINERRFGIRQMDQFYWLVDGRTLIGHQMPVSIVGMRPERHLSEPNAFWDHGLMRELCPTAEADVLGDSDDFLMMELRDREVAAEHIVRSWPSPGEMGAAMVAWVTPYQREFAHRPLTLHSGDVPAGIDKARRELHAFVDEVLSYSPRDLPSHLDHPQWRYHHPPFMAARHAYLSARLGATTETTPPPADVSELDRAWWRLDGIEKASARKCGEVAALANRRRQLIQAALGLREAALRKRQSEIGEQLLLALEDFSVKEREWTPALFDHVMLRRDGAPGAMGLGSRDTSALATWIGAIAMGDDGQRQLQAEIEAATTHRELLKTALRYIDQEEQRNLRSLHSELEVERAPFLAAYKRLLGKPLKSAAIPQVVAQRGPVTDPPAAGGRRLRHWLFGCLPRVRRLHPYWAAVRDIVRIVDVEAARGARDVLIVASGTGVITRIANQLPGLHAWVSAHGIASGNFASAFDKPPQFDLCVCELAVSELSQLDEIFEAARPFMRAGGKMVAFHLSTEWASIDGLLSSALDDLGDSAHVYCTGTVASTVPGAAVPAVTFRTKRRGAVTRLLAALVNRLGGRRGFRRPASWIRRGSKLVAPRSVTVEVEV